MNAKKNRIEGNIGIVGMGRVGSVLAYQGQKVGLKIAVVLDNDPKAQERLSQLLPIMPSMKEKDLETCSVVIIAVPDREIDAVTYQLLSKKLISAGSLLAHPNGFHIWDSAAINRDYKVISGSIHPLMAFPQNPLDARSLDGIGFSIDGVEEAQRDLSILVERFKGIPIKIPAEGKILYHAAAVFASNFPVVLQSIALEIFESIGMEKQSARIILNALLDSVKQNLTVNEPRKAISGPAARGDWATIETHIQELKTRFPDLVGLYQALTEAIIKMLHAKES